MRGKQATVNEGVVDPRGMFGPGDIFMVEDKASVVFDMAWQNAKDMGNWAAVHYDTRVRRNGLPNDDEAYYGKIGGLGHILHRSEFTYAE